MNRPKTPNDQMATAPATSEHAFLVRRDLALSYLAMGRIEDGVRELVNALKIRPDDEECRMRLVDARKLFRPIG